MTKSSGRIRLEEDPDVDGLVFGIVPVLDSTPCLELPEAIEGTDSSLEPLDSDEDVEASILLVEPLFDILFGVKVQDNILSKNQTKTLDDNTEGSESSTCCDTQ